MARDASVTIYSSESPRNSAIPELFNLLNATTAAILTARDGSFKSATIGAVFPIRANARLAA